MRSNIWSWLKRNWLAHFSLTLSGISFYAHFTYVATGLLAATAHATFISILTLAAPGLLPLAIVFLALATAGYVNDYRRENLKIEQALNTQESTLRAEIDNIKQKLTTNQNTIEHYNHIILKSNNNAGIVWVNNQLQKHLADVKTINSRSEVLEDQLTNLRPKQESYFSQASDKVSAVFSWVTSFLFADPKAKIKSIKIDQPISTPDLGRNPLSGLTPSLAGQQVQPSCRSRFQDPNFDFRANYQRVLEQHGVFAKSNNPPPPPSAVRSEATQETDTKQSAFSPALVWAMLIVSFVLPLITEYMNFDYYNLI